MQRRILHGASLFFVNDKIKTVRKLVKVKKYIKGEVKDVLMNGTAENHVGKQVASFKQQWFYILVRKRGKRDVIKFYTIS